MANRISMSSLRTAVRLAAAATIAMTIAVLGVTPASAAAPTAASYRAAARYNVGVYFWLECEGRGQDLVSYYRSQGYGATYECLYWGGQPPIHNALLRVTLYW
ncbi:hypothetical protein [Streptomyces sp. NPDC056549]|uniref:hypothetical protein n=1 Tax=Streptomyces sp. NPDC056549 TaxID=3345864 RepID=UPI0036D0059A